MNYFMKFSCPFVEEMALQYSLASISVYGGNVNDTKLLIQDHINNKYNVKPVAQGLETQP